MDKPRYIPRTSRLTAVVYIAGAVFGLLLSLGGLVALWATRAEFTAQVNEMVSLTGRTLEAGSGTVEVAGQVLNRTAGNLTLAHEMIGELSGTVENGGDMLSSTSELVGEDMVDFVANTQASLTSLQTSGRLIDDFLAVVSRVPFVGGRYQPAVPLEEGFARVSRSMEPLDETFTQLRVDLDRASASADTFQAQLGQLNKQVDAIQTDLDAAQEIVAEYRQIFQGAQERYDRFAARLPLLLNVFYLGATSLLIWMLMTQVGMLLHGLEMMRVENP